MASSLLAEGADGSVRFTLQGKVKIIVGIGFNWTPGLRKVFGVRTKSACV